MSKVHGHVAVLAAAKVQGRDRQMVATYSRPESGAVVVRARVAPVRRELIGAESVISEGIL